MTSIPIRIPARIAALLAATASAVALVLATPGQAGAVTAPAVASPEQAGYAATGAQFRYVQASFTLPDAADFASEIGGLGLSVHLWSAHSVIVLGVSNSTTAGNYNAAAAVFNPVTKTTVCSTAGSGTGLCSGVPADWTDGSVSFTPGDFLTESIYYNRTPGTTTFEVTDVTSGASLAYTRTAGKGIMWTQARRRRVRLHAVGKLRPSRAGALHRAAEPRAAGELLRDPADVLQRPPGRLQLVVDAQQDRVDPERQADRRGQRQGTRPVQ
jgi:hypothetical protein